MAEGDRPVVLIGSRRVWTGPHFADRDDALAEAYRHRDRYRSDAVTAKGKPASVRAAVKRSKR